MKLYYGGFGDYKTFAVAENEQEAIERIGKKINAPFLPVAAEEISEVDGFAIVPGGAARPETTADEPDKPVSLRQCKKCDFACESQGDLLRHYREQHPKGD